MSTKNQAQVIVNVGGSRYTFIMEDVDLDANRNALALDIGRRIVDSIWEATEGSEV